MPFGLSNGLAVIQEFMSVVLLGYDKFAIDY